MASETELPLYLAEVEADRQLQVLGDHESDPLIVMGRMPVGGSGDESEFDFLPRNENEIDQEQAKYAFAAPQDNTTQLPTGQAASGQPGGPAQSTPGNTVMTGDDDYPVLLGALEHYVDQAERGRVARVDTDESYDGFVCDHAVRELERRMAVLEHAMAEHEADPHAHQRTEVIGAAQAVKAITQAQSADDAQAALFQVPISLPPFAQGKVRCWQDGSDLICSMRVAAPDGTPRVVTMATKGKGQDKVTGLVRETARTALKAQRDIAVCGMDDQPLYLLGAADHPLMEALEHTQHLADHGVSEAAHEMNRLRKAGRANRALAEVERRKHQRQAQTSRATVMGSSALLQAYARAAGWV